MRIWRDIPSKRFAEKTLDGTPGCAQLKTPGPGPGFEVGNLLLEIQAYHAIKKDELGLLGQRERALRAIAAKVVAIFGAHESSQRNTLGDLFRRAYAKRALAKAEYLRILQQYYVTNQGEAADPSQLYNEIIAERPASMDPKLIGLHGGVAMERKDPLHREFEIVIVRNPGGGVDFAVPSMSDLNSYLKGWLQSVRAGAPVAPFFVYLEATEHCCDREVAKGSTSIPYANASAGDGKGRISILRITSGVVEEALVGTNVWRKFDTQWVDANVSPKGGEHRTLAYNWTAQKELFVGVHSGEGAERFHHSSFTGGGLIRCAGMIGARDGDIVWLDNNSGHYLPPTDNLHRLAKHLLKRNAFAPDALVQDLSQKEASPAGSSAGYPAVKFVENPRPGAVWQAARPAGLRR